MPEQQRNTDPSAPRPALPVTGAFEIFEENYEELITLTRTGQLLQAGDFLPSVPGIELEDRPFILHTVNAFGTETCDTCTDELETFHRDNPDIPIYSLTKQSAVEIAAEDAKRAKEGKPPVTHKRITVDHETAIDLGVALAPGRGAAEDFWPTALRRTLAVIDPQGQIVDIQQPDDQEQVPDFERVYDAVRA